MKDNILRNEATDMGGDGGGGAVASAPAAESSAPDVFGSSAAQGNEHTMSMDSAPAATGNGLFGQIYNAEGSLTDNWSQTLESNQMGDYSKLIGKYNSFNDLVKGFHNANSLLGKKALNPEAVTVPTEASSEDDIAAYRKAIGVPESATAYDIQPENMPDGLEWNDEVSGFWQGKFHELGIGQDTAVQIAQAYSDFTGQQLENAHQTIAAREAEQMEGMRAQVQKEWGANYDQNMEKAVNMATVQGFDFDNPDDMAAVRNPKVLNMLLAKHDSLQEGTMPRGGEPTPNGKGFREQANELALKYPNMQAAPIDIQHKYLELRKLGARG